jgi:hypothetical protein
MQQYPNDRSWRPDRRCLLSVRCHRRQLASAGSANRRSATSSSSPRAALLAPADAGSARTTTSACAGNAASRARIKCRSRRCTRCRTTEPPTLRPTTKPTLGPRYRLADGPAQAMCTTTELQPARRPRCTAAAKSSRRVSRAAAGSNATDPRTSTLQADSSLRPLRRRAAMMARPARVRMRKRNPWVFARRRLFGWKVRLPLVTAVVLPVLGSCFGSQPSGLRSSRVVPSRHRRHCCAPGERTASAVSTAGGQGAQECPPVGERRPKPKQPVAAPSKPGSGVTVRATRRYIGGACLHGVLVAVPQVCSPAAPDSAGSRADSR